MEKQSLHPSGLRVITYEMPHMNSVSSGIWIGAGGRNETEEISGISHFIEHLVFKGTKKREGKEISQAVEGVGGVLNAFTGEEYTCFYTKAMSEYFAPVFDVLWDMVSNTYFNDKHIEKEKLVVKEEVSMYLDLPGQYVHDLLSGVLWPDQPLGRPLLGTIESIDAISQESVLDYKNKLYTLDNIIVAIAGNIKHESAYDVVSKCVSDFQIAKNNKLVTPDAIEAQKNSEFSIKDKDTEQAHLALAIRSYPRNHEDRYILKVLNTILGENMSSRFFQAVREKHGLAYAIHSSVERYKDTGALVVSAGTEPRNMNKAIELILKEMKGVSLEGVSADELKRAKKYSIGQLSLGLEKTMNIMMWIGESLLTSDKVTGIDEILENIKKVSIDDIVRVSEDLFKDSNLNLAVIGPIKDNKATEQILHFK